MAPVPEQLLSNSLSTSTNTNRSSVLTNSIQSYIIYDDVDLCNSKLYTDINDSHLLNNNRSSFHSNGDDDSKEGSSHNNSQTPLEQFDLRQDYENAIDCLVNCESLISTLQQRLKVKDEKLQLKDEHISNLEETIIKMSLQLANLKASEDEYKMSQRRRSSMNDMPDMISLSKDDFGLNDDDPLSKSLVIRAVDNRLIKAVQKESSKKKKKQQQEEFERSTSSLPETLSTKVGIRRGLSMPDDGNYAQSAQSAQSLGYNPVSNSNRRLKEKKKRASRRKSLLDFNQTVSSLSDEEAPAAPPPSTHEEEERSTVKRTTSTTSSRRWSHFIDGLTSEEGTDNLDVSCWDKDRTDNLDISTYSLPILDNSKGGGKLSSLFSRSKDLGGLNGSTRTGSTVDTSERRGSLDMSVSERGGGLASSTSTSGGSIGGQSGGTAEGGSTNHRRRPTSKARTLRQYQKSSRSFLEGVVFPESMEDIHKGLDPRASLERGGGVGLDKKGLRELSDTYIGSYRELEETVGFVQKNDWRGSRAA